MAFSYSQDLDNLYTTTWQNMRESAIDQIFDATPFWFWMKKGNRLKEYAGGRRIELPLTYAKSPTVKFFGRGGAFNLGENEFMTLAAYDWKYFGDQVTRYGQDDQQNRGAMQIINYAEAKLTQVRNTLADTLETTLFGANVASPLSFLGLQDLVPDDPTTGTIGGINRATASNSWWRSKAKNMTGLSFAANGVPELRTLLNQCGNNLGDNRPDIIVSGQTPYEWYEDSVIDQKRIVNQKLGDAGFENIEYKGIPMIWSPSCASTRMYLLNTRFFYMIYDPMYYFEMTNWKEVPTQPFDRTAQIVLAGELCVDRMRCHGVLYNIDTQ